MKKHILILKHTILNSISDNECQEAISEHFNNAEILDILNISPVKTTKVDLQNLDWERTRKKQNQIIVETILPTIDKYTKQLLEKNSSLDQFSIAYFGHAPIPLAIHLGYRLGNYHHFELAFQEHSGAKKWYFEKQSISNLEFTEDLENLSKPIKAKGDINLRLGISFKVSEEDTISVKEDCTQDFNIELTKTSPSVITTPKNWHLIEQRFLDHLNHIKNYYPKTETINLFAAVPVGIAFIVGTKINPTIYPPVQLFQYFEGNNPKYQKALIVSANLDNSPILTKEQKLVVKEKRQNLAVYLKEKIFSFVENQKASKYDSWISAILQDTDNLPATSFWTDLPLISNTILGEDTTFNTKITDLNGNFDYDRLTKEWLIDDLIIHSWINRNLKNTDFDIEQAFRMFIFHETLHFSQHNLYGAIANSIGSFPKVIEDADYQADVWALLYEYLFSLTLNARTKNDLKLFFHNAIDTAIETVWSFNDVGADLKEIQIRRMNRFFIWYWQQAQIKNFAGEPNVSDIFNILFTKPTIEFAGLPIQTVNDRIIYDLTAKPSIKWEISIFFKNKISRFGIAELEDLIIGFQKCDSNRIKLAIEKIWNNINR